MQRYEYVEGTHSKFWTIDRQGTSVTTGWGRIGTAGQSKQKPFASEALAEKEFARLVAEKTHAGYKAVGRGAAPAKAASAGKPMAAKPHASATKKREQPPLTTGEVRWTPALKASAAEAAADLVDSKPPASTAELYARVKQAVDEDSRENLVAGLAEQPSADLAAKTRAALAAYVSKKPSTPRALAAEAVAAQLFSERVNVIRFLCAQEGVVFALKVFVESQRYQPKQSEHDDSVMLQKASAVDLSLDEQFGLQVGGSRIDRVLRAALAAAPAAEQAKARAYAERVRAGGDPHEKALMAAIFLEPDWVNEVLRASGPANLVVTGEMILAATDHEARLACLRDGERSKELFGNWCAFERVLLDRERKLGPEILGAHMVGMFIDYESQSYDKSDLGKHWKPLLEAVQTVVGSRQLVDGQLELLKYFHGEKLKKSEDPRLALMTGVRANAALALTVLKERMKTDKGKWASELAADLGRIAAHAAAPSQASTDDTSLEMALGKPGKLPAFWVPAALPRPLGAKSGAPLSLATLDALATRLRAGDTAPVAKLRAACEPASLGAFAWGVYNAWFNAGADSKEKWALEALGYLGDDEVANKLTRLVSSWPRESFMARAALGLDALARIGSQAALATVADIAARGHFPSLRAHARELLEQLAKTRGTSVTSLTDRAVPTLGFTADGGPFAIDSALAPKAKDKAKSKDDSPLRGELRALARRLAYRLELAMLQERRWTPAEFDEVFVQHPLLRRVARGLAWGAIARGTGLRVSFSLAADGALVDAVGTPVKLRAREDVGLLHPVSMADADLAAWRARAKRESLAQLFDQLERATFPTSNTTFQRWFSRPREVTTASVLGLKTRGWQFPSPSVGASIDTITKEFKAFGEVTIVLEPGIDLSNKLGTPKQVVSVSFLREDWGDTDGWIHPSDRKIDVLPNVMKSELMKELSSLV